MRLLVSLSLLVLYAMHGSWAVQFLKSLEPNPAYPGKCYDPELKVAFAVNASITDHETCTNLLCREGEEGKFLVIGTSCASPRQWPENCVLTDPGLDKDYPFCCQQLECDGDPEGSFAAVGK